MPTFRSTLGGDAVEVAGADLAAAPGSMLAALAARRFGGGGDSGSDELSVHGVSQRVLHAAAALLAHGATPPVAPGGPSHELAAGLEYLCLGPSADVPRGALVFRWGPAATSSIGCPAAQLRALRRVLSVGGPRRGVAASPCVDRGALWVSLASAPAWAAAAAAAAATAPPLLPGDEALPHGVRWSARDAAYEAFLPTAAAAPAPPRRDGGTGAPPPQRRRAAGSSSSLRVYVGETAPPRVGVPLGLFASAAAAAAAVAAARRAGAADCPFAWPAASSVAAPPPPRAEVELRGEEEGHHSKALPPTRDSPDDGPVFGKPAQRPLADDAGCPCDAAGSGEERGAAAQQKWSEEGGLSGSSHRERGLWQSGEGRDCGAGDSDGDSGASSAAMVLVARLVAHALGWSSLLDAAEPPSPSGAPSERDDDCTRPPLASPPAAAVNDPGSDSGSRSDDEGDRGDLCHPPWPRWAREAAAACSRPGCRPHAPTPLRPPRSQAPAPPPLCTHLRPVNLVRALATQQPAAERVAPPPPLRHLRSVELAGPHKAAVYACAVAGGGGGGGGGGRSGGGGGGDISDGDYAELYVPHLPRYSAPCAVAFVLLLAGPRADAPSPAGADATATAAGAAQPARRAEGAHTQWGRPDSGSPPPLPLVVAELTAWRGSSAAAAATAGDGSVRGGPHPPPRCLRVARALRPLGGGADSPPTAAALIVDAVGCRFDLRVRVPRAAAAPPLVVGVFAEGRELANAEDVCSQHALLSEVPALAAAAAGGLLSAPG